MCESDENGSIHEAISLPKNLEKSVTRSKKKSNVREAIIAEIDQEREEYKRLSNTEFSHLGNYIKIFDNSDI